MLPRPTNSSTDTDTQSASASKTGFFALVLGYFKSSKSSDTPPCRQSEDLTVPPLSQFLEWPKTEDGSIVPASEIQFTRPYPGQGNKY